jgi:hypothetical protein
MFLLPLQSSQQYHYVQSCFEQLPLKKESDRYRLVKLSPPVGAKGWMAAGNESRFQRWRFWAMSILGALPQAGGDCAPLALKTYLYL